jgi:hypothetical protein
MKNILFIINTEGHLLTAASLIFEKFNKTKEYQPYVLQVGKTGSLRFKNEVNKSKLTEHYLIIDEKGSNTKTDIKQLLETSFDKVFIFLEQLSLNVYLSDYFKKKGSAICLAPDGNKPYYSIDKPALRSRLKATFEIYLYLYKRKLYYTKPYFLSWNYGKSSPLDEIWVTYPDAFAFSNNKKTVGFTVMPNQKVVNKIISFFNVDITDEVKHKEDVIFYTNNIFYKKDVYDFEIETIKKIKEKFPFTPFYIKLHPQTPKDIIAKFKELKVICFCNSIPAELYIASLKDSIIIGFWSASQMIDNPSCKFYWLHKYLIKKGKMIDYINLVNPTKHIMDIDNIDNLKF